MRIDKYLKVSRIIKRRTIANDACDLGRVMLNGRTCKAGTDVRAGDIIEVRFGAHTTKYEVTTIEESAGKAAAKEMYRILP